MTTLAGRGLEPARVQLPNGAVVIAKESRTSPAVTISVAFQAGSVCDPAATPGVAHFLSRVIDRGTERRSAHEIAEQFDSLGVALHAAVTRHLLSMSCTCLADDFETILALVAEIIATPGLPEHEIETRRREIVTRIRQDEDHPGIVAVERLMALLYRDGHPYGRPLKGTIESVERIDRRALDALYRARLAPSTMSLVIVGDVAEDRAIESAARVLEGWTREPAGPMSVPRASGPASRSQVIVPMMNKAQADIAYGFTTIVRSDPAYYALTIMNNVLGQSALGGRLGDSIRERQGMAYYVYSSFDANVAEGPLVIRAGVSPANVERTLAAVDEEVERMAAAGVTDRELAESQQYLIGSLPRMLETNAGIAAFLQNAEYFGLGLDHDRRLPDLLAAVTADDVAAVARRVLHPARAAVVVAGPYA